MASEYILIPFPIVGIIVIFLVPLMIPSEKFSGGWTKDGVNRRVQLITWYPFTCDEGTAYLLTYLSQLYFGVFVTSVFASVEIIQIQIAEFLLYEMETLAGSIRNLDERVRIHFFKEIGVDRSNLTKTDLYKHPVYQMSARYCIIENIKHHKKIMKSFELYCKIFRLTTFYAYLVGTGVIAICLITLNIKHQCFGRNEPFQRPKLNHLQVKFRLRTLHPACRPPRQGFVNGPEPSPRRLSYLRVRRCHNFAPLLMALMWSASLLQAVLPLGTFHVTAKAKARVFDRSEISSR
ncbi:unnamed protein product [Nesidiocoris tenuis]|uniref:Odorant receptor n=1 Tax=Nesidiocoris tenuis TaxID=355587 RepID=A0A6H5H5X1_9HEMI|nr:unnamed protein product [Nesidiocoris tenuis]